MRAMDAAQHGVDGLLPTVARLSSTRSRLMNSQLTSIVAPDVDQALVPGLVSADPCRCHSTCPSITA